MSDEQTLPHWNMDVVYPGLDSDEFKADLAKAKELIASLDNKFDEWQINKRDDADVDETTVQRFEAVVTEINEIADFIGTLQAYLFSYLSTDSRNTTAHAYFSQFKQPMAQLSKMQTRLTAWLGSMDTEALVDQSDVAQQYQYMIYQAKMGATKLMSPTEEALAADLRITGSNSWGEMFRTYSSQLTVEMELDGEKQEMPLTAAQNLAFSEDRDVREQAYTNSLKTLEKAAVPMAAALNAIKGEAITLSKKRGWDEPLDQVLFNNSIDRATFDAMQTATRNAFPDFQRYLKTRAKLLGLDVMRWYDRLAPIGKSSQSWSYDDAAQFVVDQFGTYSDKLRDMAARAFSEGWVDAEPRDGKRGGAFCMPLRRDESRIMMNFEPSFTSVSTMAHEFGHAYHNVALSIRPPLQRGLPMTLAETASTFCQKIVENAALKTATPNDQLIITDGQLEYAARVVLGATSNFIFEDAVFKKRAERELSVEEFIEMDQAAQKEGVGDAIEEGYLHPYRWAYVPHYYMSHYYNFPYTFGLLFGLGLYALYQENPEEFKQGYDDLLSMTGMGEAAELASKFGIDIRSQAFWEGSLDVLRDDIARFDELAKTAVPA